MLYIRRIRRHCDCDRGYIEMVNKVVSLTVSIQLLECKNK